MAQKKRVPKSGGVKAHAHLNEAKKSTHGRDPVREEKIDRNGPCPCGSGRKYKKCCAESLGIWARIKSWFSF